MYSYIQKFLIVTGIIVCFGVLNLKGQSCCGNPCVSVGSENIFNFTALSKKRVVLETNAYYTHFNSAQHSSNTGNSGHNNHHSPDNSTNEHASLQSVLLNTAQIRYGLQDKITLQTQLSFWSVNTSKKHAFIFGDVPLLATFKIAENENYGGGILTGIELPTGKNYVVFENNYLITGSGSFDPLAGAFFWFKHKKLISRIQTEYKQGMKGFDNIHFGSNINTQWIVAYYLKGLNTEKKWKINLNTGLNQEWTNAHSLNGKFIDNTGSFILWYHAGTQIQYKKWLFPLSFTVPAYMQLRGVQNEPQIRIKTGLMLLF